MVVDNWSIQDPFAIYVHIPFCVKRCPYCDFNSRSADRKKRNDYIECLIQEILGTSIAGASASTLFLGGGTPTELTGDEVGQIIDALEETLLFGADSEWTIECNPGTINPTSCDRLNYLGFNRISIGFQSLNDVHLQKLGRIHSAEDAIRCYSWLRGAGFENLNIDLIFGIPGQSLEDWKEDLYKVIDLGPEHLSLYNLTVENGTPYGRLHARGMLPLPPEDTVADMYEVAMDITEIAGYQQYEISNFSLPGYECAHNLSYWSNSPYMGFGLSAASYVDGVRWINTNDWDEYLNGVRRGVVPKSTEERLGRLAGLAEEIMLRIRTRFGISPQSLGEKYQTDFYAHFGRSVEFLIENGLLASEHERLHLTRRGRLLANEVCREFLDRAQDAAS